MSYKTEAGDGIYPGLYAPGDGISVGTRAKMKKTKEQVLERTLRASWDALNTDEKVVLHMAVNFPEKGIEGRIQRLFAPNGEIHGETKKVIRILAKEMLDAAVDDTGDRGC